MKNSIVPQTYEDWKHCIVVDCGLELTPEYISARISALQDSSDYYTQQFVKQYGEEYLQAVLGWFKQAQKTV